MANIRNLQVEGYSNFQGRGWFDIRKYGAKGDGTSNDTAAIQAAINAAALVGGQVFSPPGNFKHTQLTIPGNVSILGCPDQTFWLFDHATANALVFTGYNDGGPVLLQDIRFLGNVVTTGTHIVNNSEAQVQLNRCSWNGINSGGGASNNLQGKLASLNATGSKLDFIDCRLKVAGALRGIDIISGAVKVTRGTVTMPVSYGDGLMYVGATGALDLDDVRIDGSLHTTGPGYFVYGSNGSNIYLNGCRLLGGGSVGSKRFIGWDAGARIIERGTIIGSVPAMERYGSTALLSNYSSLELLGYLTAYPASPYTIPNGTRHISLAFNGTAPTLTMPAKLFLGQRMSVSVFNDGSGGNWAGVTTIGLHFGGTNGINNNNGRSFEAVVTDRNGDGTSEWVTVGNWSDMFG